MLRSRKFSRCFSLGAVILKPEAAGEGPAAIRRTKLPAAGLLTNDRRPKAAICKGYPGILHRSLLLRAQSGIAPRHVYTLTVEERTWRLRKDQKSWRLTPLAPWHAAFAGVSFFVSHPAGRLRPSACNGVRGSVWALLGPGAWWWGGSRYRPTADVSHLACTSLTPMTFRRLSGPRLRVPQWLTGLPSELPDSALFL